MINFGRHKILECAREILEKSQNVTLDKDSFIRISDDLEVMLSEVSTFLPSPPLPSPPLHPLPLLPFPPLAGERTHQVRASPVAEVGQEATDHCGQDCQTSRDHGKYQDLNPPPFVMSPSRIPRSRSTIYNLISSGL